MAEPVTDPLAPQCGNCRFWFLIPKHPQGAIGECHGTPPTPCVVGARPRQFGSGVDYQLEMMRPIMAAVGNPCSLHKRAAVLDLAALGPSSKLNA